MFPDSYISDAEQEKIREEYGSKLIAFNDLRNKLKDWYDDLSLEYPHSCENNYRDSWFHYRKIYKEHSVYEAVCQSANFDEHLQRAEKDAIIHLSQEMVSVLEYWYFIGDSIDTELLDHMISKSDQKEALAIFDKAQNCIPSQWVYNLQKSCSSNNEKFAEECVFIILNRIYSTQFRKKIQQVLHEIKNIVLDIRTSGARIERPLQPGYYIKHFQNCYDDALDVCYQYGLTGLFSVTWTVARELRSKNLVRCESTSVPERLG